MLLSFAVAIKSMTSFAAVRVADGPSFVDTIPGNSSASMYDVRFIPGAGGADMSLIWDTDTLRVKTSDRRGADPLEPMAVKVSYQSRECASWSCDTLLKPGSSDRMLLKFLPVSENISRVFLLSGDVTVLSGLCASPRGILRGYLNKRMQEPERFLLSTPPYAMFEGHYEGAIIDSIIAGSSDKRCTRWRFLDMDYENTVFSADRTLELATVPVGNGIYDIVYTGSRYPERRAVAIGAVTGRLLPTQIPDLYRLLWRMADGKTYPIESSCSFNGALIMELFFPEQGMARIRFENTTMSANNR